MSKSCLSWTSVSPAFRQASCKKQGTHTTGNKYIPSFLFERIPLEDTANLPQVAFWILLLYNWLNSLAQVIEVSIQPLWGMSQWLWEHLLQVKHRSRWYILCDPDWAVGKLIPRHLKLKTLQSHSLMMTL